MVDGMEWGPVDCRQGSGHHVIGTIVQVDTEIRQFTVRALGVEKPVAADRCTRYVD
ncbi:MAG: hypothetical protein ACJ735_02220 [Actinomycetes bacterium]